MSGLFGTDGIRARAGEGPLAAASLERLGAVLGLVAAPGPVVIGRDTRASGAEIERAVVSTIGRRVLSLGVAPTPVVAILTGRLGASLGIAISASHNPAHDNGLKFFGSDTKKLPDGREREIERLYEGPAAAGSPGAVEDAGREIERYLERFQADLHGMKIVVDCAHGATVRTAPGLLRRLGADVFAIGDAPDGANINAGVGAVHPEAMQAKVRQIGADLGMAFDGDGDRVIFADESGRRQDGDAVLYLCAPEAGARTVVGTSMTNYGLEKALAAWGIALERAAVGDRYVFEKMEALDAPIGGEPSGHVIFGREPGDGLATALNVLKIVRAKGRTLGALCAGLTMYPQRIHNIPVKAKRPIDQMPSVTEAVERASRGLDGRGRVVVRYSGTEPLLRVMVEAPQATDVDRWVDAIAAAVQKDMA